MARKRPVLTASSVTRQMFKVIADQGLSDLDLCKLSGVHFNSLYQWRTGRASANVINIEAVLEAMGFELVIRPIIQTEPKDLLPWASPENTRAM